MGFIDPITTAGYVEYRSESFCMGSSADHERNWATLANPNRTRNPDGTSHVCSSAIEFAYTDLDDVLAALARLRKDCHVRGIRTTSQ